MKTTLKIACAMTAAFSCSFAHAQDGNITLTANMSAICKLQAATGFTNGAFSGTVSGLDANIAFASPDNNFANAASTKVTYSALQNVRCRYNLKSIRGGMRHQDSTRRDYTATIDDNIFTSPPLTTNGTQNASVNLDADVTLNPKTIEINIDFAAAPSGFTPSQGEYKDTLVLTVSPTT